ncbi:FecR family protein [Mangrovibacterium diazotrophicum]|uniref:FecR family protein n=1 Tax=Mangrovibacterium diazotrophicum TaxID=1261403 RepID=A0A419VXL7_9BACT|nr:FecR family protein [Mangrovibacterium diazotrophicum]RKD87972.1 FecR family protein [Mangrovibacterium diazotrophicum]
MKQKDLDRIDDYFRNQSSDDEQFVRRRFSDDLEEEALFSLSEKHWNQASSEKVDLRHVLRKIHHDIQKDDATPANYKQVAFRWYSRVAAVLMLPLFIASLYTGIKYYQTLDSVAEIHAPKGSRIQFHLPDGSAGYLNGGSSLTYAANFKNNRRLQLNGEAYFEVEKDRSHPFVVQTNPANIQVLGTKFDVRAYSEDDELITTLEEGSVEIFNKANNTTSRLSPGEQNRIDTQSGSMSTNSVNTKFYTSWKEETLQLDNTPFADVLKQMERWYGVDFIVEKDMKETQNYTMTIKTESLREMLQLMALTTAFRYEINGNKVIIKSLNE